MTHPSEAGICARGLSVGYRSELQPVLSGFDLDVPVGHVTLLFGASGSGKTTLLSAFAGLLRPQAGTLTAWGHDMAGLRGSELLEYRRSVGIVFQSFHLIPSLSAWENVALPLRLAGWKPGAARLRAFEALDALGMAGHSRRRPGRMSGGQRQRVAIARAVGARPRLVLADEPTAHLDAASAADTVSLLAGLVSPGVAVVVATHDPRFAVTDSRVVHLGPDVGGPAGVSGGSDL